MSVASQDMAGGRATQLPKCERHAAWVLSCRYSMEGDPHVTAGLLVRVVASVPSDLQRQEALDSTMGMKSHDSVSERGDLGRPPIVRRFMRNIGRGLCSLARRSDGIGGH